MPKPEPARHAAAGTRAVLDALIDGDAAAVPDLRQLCEGLGERGFGLLLLVAALPAFIPIPAGGAVSGPLVALLALQLLLGRRRPWLPAFLARRSPRREALLRFERLADPWLRRLERLVRPRLPRLFEHPLALALTGALVLLIGLLLSLPIPLTNYLFGGLVLLFALALLERDGGLLLLAWALGAGAVGASATASGRLLALAGDWLAA